MRFLALFLLGAPVGAQIPGRDLVLLLEKTSGLEQPLAYHDFRALRPEDRVAVMTFAERSKVRQPFTSDPKKLEQALRQAARNPTRPHVLWKTQPKVRLIQSLSDAARLFDTLPPDSNRRRLILTVFGSEDDAAASGLDEVKQAFLDSRIQLYALAIAKFDPAHARDSRMETPPTFPGRTPPVPAARLPIPEQTLRVLQRIAAATGGAGAAGEANVPPILRLAGLSAFGYSNLN